jgi:hypothetical protein
MNVDREIPLHLVAALPSLDGGTPPATCPVCGSLQVPPESDDGIPPPELHQYRCNASYALPEDQPGPWQPCHRCGRVPLLSVAAWIRDRCVRCGSAAAADITQAISQLALPESSKAAALEVLFGNFRGEDPPLTCPSCGAHGKPDSPGFRDYSCGASVWSTSARPSPSGYIPMSWAGRGGCPRAPIALLLKILHAKAVHEGDASIVTATDIALKQLERAQGDPVWSAT